mgnify:CR=1 FL=1
MLSSTSSSFEHREIFSIVWQSSHEVNEVGARALDASLEMGPHGMPLIEYEDASPEVRAVYDDIMETRQVDWVNNFWKALAADPFTLARTWESVKQVMAPGGALEMVRRAKDEGLVRFDGVRFTVVDGRGGPLSLLGDREGGLWYAPFGRGVTRRSDGRATTWTALKTVPFLFSALSVLFAYLWAAGRRGPYQR